MKQTQILSGNFAIGKDAITGKDKAGNFSGYNAKGKRIFIHKAQMEALGFKTDADLKGKFPLFAIVDDRELPVRDENGEVTNPPVMTKRLQALSVFTTKEAMISAYNSDAEFEIAAKSALQNTAKTAGLSVEAVNALLAEV